MPADIDSLGTCPECGADWSDGDIFDKLRGQTWCSNKTDEELHEFIRQTYSPPYKFSRLIGVQIQGGYDGVAYWLCPDCKKKFTRTIPGIIPH